MTTILTRPTAEGARRTTAPTTRGGAHLIEVQVVARAEAAHDAVTLWLATPSTRRAPLPYQPGQFITLVLPRPGGLTVQRSYSLCGIGDPSQPWEITIKRQPGGLVSPYLCETLRPGMVLKTTAPTGTFILPARLDERGPLVLVASGSGITPIMSLARALATMPETARPPVQLHYAYHSPTDGIYARELLALDPDQRWLRQWHYISKRGDRLTPANVRATLGHLVANAEVYFCGSRSLRTALEADLRDLGITCFHVETFASPHRAPPTADGHQTGGDAVRIRVADDGAVVTARPGETLLETLERAGYACSSSCRAGACGTCRLKVLAGQVRDDGDALTPQERAAGYVLSCVAQPSGDVTVAGMGSRAMRPNARVGSRAGKVAANGRRPGGTLALRWALVTASLAVFLGAGHTILDSATHTASTSTSTSTSTSSSSSSSTSSSSATGSSGTSSGTTSSGSSSLPSGSSSISSGSNQPSSSSSSSVS